MTASWSWLSRLSCQLGMSVLALEMENLWFMHMHENQALACTVNGTANVDTCCAEGVSLIAHCPAVSGGVVYNGVLTVRCVDADLQETASCRIIA